MRQARSADVDPSPCSLLFPFRLFRLSRGQWEWVAVCEEHRALDGERSWLASLGGGGGSFNYQPGGGGEIRKIDDAISQIPHPILVASIVLVIVVVLILIVVFAWLRARGGFMFVDCIVKNRGAIAEPWRDFRKEGNSYFLFSLLIVFGLLIFAGLLSLPLVLPAIQNDDFLRTHDVYLISAFAAWILVMILFVLACRRPR